MLLVSEVDGSREVKYAKGSEALSVKFWIGRTRFFEVPGEHSTAMDKKCSEVTQGIEPDHPRSSSLGTTERSLPVASKSPRGHLA